MVEIARIIKALEANLNGKSWFGDNLETQLMGIDADTATIAPKNLNHSIAEILNHMMAWRIFAIEKLNGNTDYEVWETELNWVKIPYLTNESWQKLLSQLADNQKALTETIYQKAEKVLDNKVDGRKYNFRLLLYGIIQHDIYHIGQIAIIKKLLLS